MCSSADVYSQHTKELGTYVRLVRLPGSRFYTSVSLQCQPGSRISHNTEGESHGVEGRLESRINSAKHSDIRMPRARGSDFEQLQQLALKLLLRSMLPWQLHCVGVDLESTQFGQSVGGLAQKRQDVTLQPPCQKKYQ